MARRKRLKRTQEQRVFLLQPGKAYAPSCVRARMAQYLEHLAVRNYSEETRGRAEWNLIRFASWCDERDLAELAEVTRPMIERYQRHLFYYRTKSGRPLGAITQRGMLTAVQGLFRWATRQDLIPANPASELELPRVEKRLPRVVLTAEEAERVLALPDVATALGLRDRTLLEVLYATGIRRKEVAELDVFAVHEGRMTVTVRQGKGKKDRLVPISERALSWVRRYLDEVRPKLVVEPDPKTLFLSATGLPLVADELSKLARSYVKQSGVSGEGACHVFRHSMATAMLENGADLRVIQEILGHAQLGTTSIYTHLSLRKLQEVYRATHPGAKEVAKAEEKEPEPE